MICKAVKIQVDLCGSEWIIDGPYYVETESIESKEFDTGLGFVRWDLTPISVLSLEDFIAYLERPT